MCVAIATTSVARSVRRWGYQLEAALRFDFTPEWSAGAGVRYRYASVGGTSEFVNFGTKVPLKDFTSERFGVYGDISYNF